jgi:putative CocE/NonD family hydrolase
MRLPLASALALAALAAAPAAAGAADVPAGAAWTQATIPSTDGVKLHADILRPKGLGPNDRTPVILSIGPYFNHAGQTGPAGPVEGTTYDPVGPSTGPSDRFLDFINGAHLMERGYTYMMVDLRGFGGSSGCLDWAGPGEQADVVNAVEWAAKQSWSTGNVGMYGKSYDGVTGLIGVDRRPQGLKAVVAQEPVYDLYRYLYGDGIRRLNSLLTPALYDVIAETPGPLANDPSYNANAANEPPGCPATNFADQAGNPDHGSSFWQPRNLIPGANGSDVPLFLTQGLTENNTVADGTAQYLQSHTGYERAWLGPWEHVRGNETCPKPDGTPDPLGLNGNPADCPPGRLKMGRHGFFDEVMRFYDQFLRGQAPAVADPPIAVQTNDGKWRAEDQWPPADSSGYRTALRPGTYEDQGQANATGSGAEVGVWTISPALPYDVHLAGSGRVVVDVAAGAPNANLVVDLYDLAPDGTGPLITRQGHLITKDGPIAMDLWSADWKLAAGHRIGVKVADSNGDWWIHQPTFRTVTVKGGSVTLPFLAYTRPDTIEGDPGVQLRRYLADTVSVPAATISSSESKDFAIPPAMGPRPVMAAAVQGGSTGSASATPAAAAKAKPITRTSCGSSKKKRTRARKRTRRARSSASACAPRRKAAHRRAAHRRSARRT